MIIASTYPSASISTEQLLARRAEITSVVATLILKDTNHTTTGTTSLPQFCHFVLTTMQHSFGVPVPDTRGKENVANKSSAHKQSEGECEHHDHEAAEEDAPRCGPPDEVAPVVSRLGDGLAHNAHVVSQPTVRSGLSRP